MHPVTLKTIETPNASGNSKFKVIRFDLNSLLKGQNLEINITNLICIEKYFLKLFGEGFKNAVTNFCGSILRRFLHQYLTSVCLSNRSLECHIVVDRE